MKCFTLDETGRLTPGITLDQGDRLTLARGHKKEELIMTSAERPPRATSRDGRTVYRASFEKTNGGTVHGEHIVCSVWWIADERADDRAGCLIHVTSPAFINLLQMDSWRQRCAYAFTDVKAEHGVPHFTTSISESVAALAPGETVQTLLWRCGEPHSIGALRVAGRDAAYSVPLSRTKWFPKFIERLTKRLWAFWIIARGFAR